MQVIVVDDHSLFRAGLKALFDSQPDFEVVGEAGTLKDAIALVKSQQPDLVLMDVGLPDGSGVDLIPDILQGNQNTNIVLLTIHASEELAFAAIRHGAKGFLQKDIPMEALLTALRRLEYGELAISRSMLSQMVDELTPLAVNKKINEPATEITLTGREIEVLEELGSGYYNNEIAEHLTISENTVRVHVHRILKKLGLHNRREASAYARRNGLIKKMGNL